MQSLNPENFLIEDTTEVFGHFFEYTDKKSGITPGVNHLKTILHLDSEDAMKVKAGLQIRRLATGVLYAVKEADVSGVGIVSLELERTAAGKESLGMGKF